MTHYDIAIVGAGIAGASLAAELAPHASVVLLEAEERPGYHATGRSAAFWDETYGGPGVQPLTTASGEWLRSPPPAFGGESFLSPRGAITIARAEDVPLLESLVEEFEGSGVVLEWCGRAALEDYCPAIRPEWVRGLALPSCADIDVAGLHQAYLREARRQGVELRCKAGLVSAVREGARWRVETPDGALTADILVDAAGAWADDVAVRSGLGPLGISPFRRTMVQLRVGEDVSRLLPLMVDVRGQFYFKSDGAGGIWLSPHDEIPDNPGDVAPEELDVAIAIDRFENAVDWGPIRVTHKWAGLRSFSPDRLPVYGFDPREQGFFWFAGQGGFGIQTAPAAALIGAQLILGRDADPLVAGIDAERYAPRRFT